MYIESKIMKGQDYIENRKKMYVTAWEAAEMVWSIVKIVDTFL